MRYVSAFLIAVLLPSIAPSNAGGELEQKLPRVKGGGVASPSATFRALADVAEIEPNGTPAEAQAVGCGNSLRPAILGNVSVLPDTDWVSFTASAGELITIETADDVPGQLQTDTVLNLFASDGVTILASNDDISSSDLYSRITDFQAPNSGVYYARVRGFSAKEGPYRLNISCAAAPGPPANDQCAGATTIVPGNINLSGTTRFATNDYDLCPGQQVCAASCTGFNSPGKDVVYRLAVPSAGDVITLTYNLDSPSVDASLYIVSDCGAVQASCVAGQDADFGTPSETLSHTFAAPGTYYLILDAFTPAGAAWTLTGCFACPTAARMTSWGRLKSIYR